MKLNKKGFVSSAVLYSLLLLFLALVLGLLALLSNRKQILDKLKGDIKSEINQTKNYTYYKNGTAIYYNPVTGKICGDYTEENSKTGVTEGCLKWYIFNDDKNKATVNMILDHNTTALTEWVSLEDYIEAGGTEEEYGEKGNNNKGPLTVTKRLNEDTEKWKNKARLISADEIAKITGNNSWNKASLFYFETNTSTAPSSYNGIYAWLYDNTEGCKNYGCEVEDSGTIGYWTSSTIVSNSNLACGVLRNSRLDNYYVNYIGYYGVRPVITVSKKDLQFYKEKILNGADPVYSNNLVPVTIAENGTVTIADVTQEWYKYEDKKWANAIIVDNSYDNLNALGKVNSATKKDGYVSFDGVDDYINLGFENYDFESSMTHAITVKFNKLGVQAILGNWDSAGGGCLLNESNKIDCYMYSEEDSKYYIATTEEEFETDVYYNIVFTYDGSTMNIYINGVLSKTIEASGSIKPYKTPILIGANPAYDGSAHDFANIDVKEVAIYDRALTKDEITKNFKNGIDIKNNKGLLGHYNFEESYKIDEIITENNIESYFVWIPKYKYKLFDLGNYTTYIEEKPTTSNAKEIDIVFGTSNTSDKNNNECTTPKTSGGTGYCEVGEYMTHPAFLAFNTNGLWVGKFETTGTIDNITIKPGVTALRAQTVKAMFDASYNYKRVNDSHMMKNTEWGAVAYLSHSKYGINKEVNINNNKNFLTGYSAVDGTDQSDNPGTYGTDSSVTLPYNTSTGYKASTTGNITGVYDMNGGSHEYMASYMTGQYGSSGFTTDPITTYGQKYFDKYNSTNTRSYNNRILGDSTGEIGPFYRYSDGDGTSRLHNNWYSDIPAFVDSTNSWFFRGGAFVDGVIAGQFYFNSNTGASHNYFTNRLVLTK